MTVDTTAFGGASIPPTLPDETFYGFRLNPTTGSLSVEILDGQANEVVQLPQENSLDANDYRQWIWTTNTLNFRLSEAGHLEMEVM